MSRIANAPVAIPKGVETTLSDTAISVKGSKGNLNLDLHELVGVSQEGEELKVAAKNQTRQAGALAGTFRSLINNMVVGVSEGFQKKLELQGVGYRAKAKMTQIKNKKTKTKKKKFQ
jgi:large subunit ribosomal protein L6